MINFKVLKDENVHNHGDHVHVKQSDKAEQISLLLAKQLAYTTTLTHLDLSYISFSSRTIVEFLRAIKFNQTL